MFMYLIQNLDKIHELTLVLVFYHIDYPENSFILLYFILTTTTNQSWWFMFDSPTLQYKERKQNWLGRLQCLLRNVV